MNVTTTLSAKLLQHVRDNPGITGTDIHILFHSTTTKNSIASTLGRLKRMGLIENRGPAGTRWSRWYPVKFESPDQKYIDRAKNLLEELRRYPKNERAILLARRLQDFDSKSQKKHAV